MRGKPFKKGNTPWNKDKKGLQVAWNKGLTKENFPQLSNSGTKKGSISWKKGKKLPPFTEEHKRKISQGMPKGKNHFNWKGGITKKDKLERNKFKKLLQKRIFNRDNYTCQICGVRGGFLHIDHIKSWADFLNLRFDPDNCRTLCMKCHYYITFKKQKPENVIWGYNLIGKEVNFR